jgi:branched-chain amino acid transport system ATP-binding protein
MSDATASPQPVTIGTPAAPAPLLEVRGLRAGYGDLTVVDGVDLTVGPGEVVALLGANGAGKTTTLLAISGLVARTGGTVEVLGRSVPARRRVRSADVWREARRGLAHVPEDRGLFFDLTAAENLRLGRVRGRPSLPVDAILERLPALGRVLHRKAGLLSGGEQQMLALARAMVSRPRLLLVDEMSLGLAPLVVEQLLPVLRAIADDPDHPTGVLVVEQHVSLVLSIADHGVLLRQGRIAHSGTAAELQADAAAIEAGYLGAAPTP